jgi:hypothetical protein
VSSLTALAMCRAISEARCRWKLPPLTLTLGLLGEDDNGATDLGTLEKKLAEKSREARGASLVTSNPTSPSQATSGHEGTMSTPQTTISSPEPGKTDKDGEKRKSLTPEEGEKREGEEEVEALSEMMCSLVTNTNGESRYIGK